jgi:hypothetical protein
VDLRDRNFADPLASNMGRKWFSPHEFTMLLRQTVLCDGIEYLLVYEPKGHSSKGWAWIDAVRRNPVDLSQATRLRDAFLAQEEPVHGRPTELQRLQQILLAMGASPDQVRKRLGGHLPCKCVDCRDITTDGYPGPRCTPCHEKFVRTARLRNAGNNDVSGGSMSGSRRG